MALVAMIEFHQEFKGPAPGEPGFQMLTENPPMTVIIKEGGRSKKIKLGKCSSYDLLRAMEKFIRGPGRL